MALLTVSAGYRASTHAAPEIAPETADSQGNRSSVASPTWTRLCGFEAESVDSIDSVPRSRRSFKLPATHSLTANQAAVPPVSLSSVPV